MKPRRILLACAAAFVLLMFTLLIAFNHAKPRLLVLHSFSENGHWEQLFNAGVERALARNRQPIAVRWHYMAFSDTDVQTNAEWAAASARSRAAIDAWKPDVVLIVGEEGQQWVGHRYATQDEQGPRLVYATGEDPARFGYPGAANVTGVRELLPLSQTLEVLTQLESKRLRIQALGVADPTGEAERAQVQAFDWRAHTLLPVVLAKDYAAWQQAVNGAAGKADVLLVLSFAGLPRSGASPAAVDPSEVARWTAQHAEPLTLSVRERYVQSGGALAIAPSAEALGEQAARLALQALPGKPLPAPQETENFVIGLRPDRLSSHGYQLPDIYTQAARAAHLLYQDD